MWKRQELKRQGKEAFKKNYWKTVLVSLIMTVLVGGVGAGSAASSFSNGFNSGLTSAGNVMTEEDTESAEDIKLDIESEEDVEPDVDEGESGKVTLDFSDAPDIDFKIDMSESEAKAIAVAGVVALVIFIIIFSMIFLVVFLISLALDILIVNPLLMGTQKFFVVNLHDKAKVKHVAFAFDHNYRNVVKTLFMRDLYVFLWSLLFVIPGIVKAYEYRMVPYLLAENPSMNFNEALVLSSKMMYGQKWKTFVLDLSFIGWNILSSMTFGLLGIFFVAPYQNMTNAALYEALRPKVELPKQQIVYGLNSGEQEWNTQY